MSPTSNLISTNRCKPTDLAALFPPSIKLIDTQPSQIPKERRSRHNQFQEVNYEVPVVQVNCEFVSIDVYS